MSRTTSVLTQDRVLNETWIEVSNADALLLVNADVGSHFRVVLVRNSTLGIIGGSSGRRVVVRIEEDSVGSRSLATDSSIVDNVTIDTTAGATTTLEFLYDEFTDAWEQSSALTQAAANLLYDPLGAAAARELIGQITEAGDSPPPETFTIGQLVDGELLKRSGSSIVSAGIVTGTYGGTGVNNGASTITVAANFATAGANALTLTTTGATNITLPTTGTLATRAGAEVITGKSFGMWNYAADVEASDTYVITLSPAITAYETGQVIFFKANTANTGAATLNVNGLGAKTVVKRVNTALSDNDILAGMFCLVVYDGTNFVLLNPVVN